MTNVVTLHGGETPLTGEPRESVIEELERILVMARAGEVQGIALACLHADGLGSYRLAGLVGGYALLGATEMAKAVLVEIIASD